MKILLNINIQNKTDVNNTKLKAPTFGIRIPELESAIDTFASKANNSPSEKEKLIEIIKRFAKMIFQPESFIGTGCENKVYDVGKYVFKIPKNVFVIPANTHEEPLNPTGEIIKNNDFLKIDSYYGEPLLQIGNLKILKNIGKHIPCGVPYAITDKMTIEEVYNYYFENYFSKIIRVPQCSFDKFAQDVNKISYPYTIDFQNPNNIAITNDNRIVFTDSLLKYNKYNGNNSTAKLLRIFMLDASLNIYTPKFGKYLDDAQELFKKIILSGEKAGLILSDSHEDKLLISDALYKCEAKENAEDFIKKLSKFRRSSESKAELLKKIECYIDDIFGKGTKNEKGI